MKAIHYLFLLPFLLFFSCSTFTSEKRKTATIVFESDIETTLEIYDPIDGGANSFYVTKEVVLKPGVPFTHEVNIENFAFLRFMRKNYINRPFILLLEGNYVEINFQNGEQKIGGDNAVGNEYFYAHYVQLGLSYHTNYESIESAIENDSINFEKLKSNMKNWEANLKYKKDLLTMLQEETISRNYYEVQMRNLEYVCFWNICSLFKPTSKGFIVDYKLTKVELEKMRNLLNNIFNEGNFDEVNSYKYYASPSPYYWVYYDRLRDEDERKKLREESSGVPLGTPYHYVFMPDNSQLITLGLDAVSQFQNGVGSSYSQEFLNWFQAKFPDKEYTAILTKLWQDKDERVNLKANTTFLERETINSFKDLVNVPELKGKNLYIDMWASWCSPCLAQFKYNEQTEKLLSQHKNMETLYISIDEDENDTTWKRQIDFHKLNGYHLRATKPFVEYLSKTLYEGKSVSVPRYLIIDSAGKILNDNLPRPSLKEDLEKILGACLKND